MSDTELVVTVVMKSSEGTENGGQDPPPGRPLRRKSTGAEAECTEGAMPPKVQSRDHKGAEQGSCVTC